MSGSGAKNLCGDNLPHPGTCRGFHLNEMSLQYVEDPRTTLNVEKPC